MGLDYILDRTLNRPRDVIDFLNHASQLATGRNQLSWSVLERAERLYSNNRLVALFDEWHENYAGLDLAAAKLLSRRRPRFAKSDWDEDVLLDLFTDVGVAERPWLSDLYETFTEMYQEDKTKGIRHFTDLFISVMYEVGLIGIKTAPGGPGLLRAHRPTNPEVRPDRRRSRDNSLSHVPRGAPGTDTLIWQGSSLAAYGTSLVRLALALVLQRQFNLEG